MIRRIINIINDVESAALEKERKIEINTIFEFHGLLLLRRNSL